MEDKLTKKQSKVLQFIAHKIWQEKRPPTIREIAQNLKFSSTGTVRDYLRLLREKGYIRMTKRKSRGLQLLDEKLLQIPIIARVQAGNPLLTYEDIEGYLNLDKLIFRHDDKTFALRVKGNSMVEAGIMPEDLILVRRQSTCQNRDIIVAWVDGEITVKYFRQRKNQAYLEPANKDYTAIKVSDNFSVIGKVISVIRSYV